RLTQQLLYQNDSAYASLGNDPLAERILKNLAGDTGASLDVRHDAAAYNDHTANTQHLNQTIGSYKLAGQTPSGGIEQADGTWQATKPGTTPMPQGAQTHTNFPVPGCTSPAGACTYTFVFGGDLAYVRVPQADGSFQLYEASKEQQTTLPALQGDSYIQGVKNMPGKVATTGLGLLVEAGNLSVDLLTGKAGQAGDVTYDSKTMQWLTNGKPLNITFGDVLGVIFSATPAGLAIGQAEGLSATDPAKANAAGTEAALAAFTALAWPGIKGGVALAERVVLTGEAKAAAAAAKVEAPSIANGAEQAVSPVAKPAAEPGVQAAESAKTAVGDTAVPDPVCPCFVAGTLIHTADGAKPIESFVGAELVFSRDEFTQEPGLRPVVATKATEDQPVFEVVIADSQGRTETLHTTAEHPFWVVNVADDPADEASADTHAQWVRAASLAPGMQLIDLQGQPLTVQSQQAAGWTATVYNIEVHEHHTYHVGELGVWVHNANCCDAGASSSGKAVDESAANAARNQPYGNGGSASPSPGTETARSAGSDVKIPNGANSAPVTAELTFDKATRTWTTPAGIDYGPGSVDGNRVKHVLEHAEPNPNKTTHTVFNVERKEVLGLVDEAWLAKSNPLPNDPGAYVVPMGRVIGTAGETSIKIIVRPGTNKIITAYPIQ
ncbi:hypothetical protein DBR42_10270, partial [Pelomonas sp. HMWF004]